MSYNPRQPRDDRGRWAPKGGLGPTAKRVLGQYKVGTLKSGRAGTPVTNHKQAFAIAKSVQARTVQKRRETLARQTGKKMERNIRLLASAEPLRARPSRFTRVPFHPAIGGGSRRHY